MIGLIEKNIWKVGGKITQVIGDILFSSKKGRRKFLTPKKSYVRKKNCIRKKIPPNSINRDNRKNLKICHFEGLAGTLLRMRNNHTHTTYGLAPNRVSFTVKPFNVFFFLIVLLSKKPTKPYQENVSKSLLDIIFYEISKTIKTSIHFETMLNLDF